MKKIIYLVLCFTIIFSLVACDNGKNNENDTHGNKNEKFEITTNQDAVEILIANNWECSKLLTKDTRENIPMESVYGSALENNKGILIFYEDGIFKHIAPGNVDDEVSTDGVYKINKEVITLSYDDNRTEEGKIVSNSTIEIITDGYIMSFSLVK